MEDFGNFRGYDFISESGERGFFGRVPAIHTTIYQKKSRFRIGSNEIFFSSLLNVPIS